MTTSQIKQTLQRICNQAHSVTSALVLERMTADRSIKAGLQLEQYLTSSLQDITYILEHIDEPAPPPSAIEYEDIIDSLSHLSPEELNHIIVRAADILRNRLEIQKHPILAPLPSFNELEKQAIIEALKQTNGNRKKAAELLQISERTIHRKINDYNL